jgi:hypothetical membrane protein
MLPNRHRAAAVCGLAVTAWAILLPLVAASALPAYSHVSQYISELGATDAPYGSLVSLAGFAPIGLLVLAFLFLVSGALPRSGLATAGLVCLGAVGASYLRGALFPCDAGCPAEGTFSQSMHSIFGLLGYVGAIAGLLLLGIAFRASPAWRSAAPVSIGAALLVAMGFLAMLAPGLEPFRGLSQRIAEAAIFLWIGFVGMRLLRLRVQAARP